MASVRTFASNLAEPGSDCSTIHGSRPRYPGLDDGDLEQLRILLLFTRKVLAGVGAGSGRTQKSVRQHKKRMRAVIKEFDRRFYGTK